VIVGLSPVGLARAALLVAMALLSAVQGSRVGLALPDLVLPVVVAGALLAGPSRGVVLGLAAGWVVDLMPPGSPVLGSSALLYAAAGLVAGAGRREGRTPLIWVAVVVAGAAATLWAGRAFLAGLVGAPVAWGEVGLRLALTTALGVVLVPALVWAEHALARRAPA
jgi:rod shape-determining protein MreD